MAAAADGALGVDPHPPPEAPRPPPKKTLPKHNASVMWIVV